MLPIRVLAAEIVEHLSEQDRHAIAGAQGARTREVIRELVWTALDERDRPADLDELIREVEAIVAGEHR